MTAHLATARPELESELVDAVNQHEFAKVVLTLPVDREASSTFGQWTFGSDVLTALCHEYTLLGTASGYYVYVPGPATAPCVAE